MSDALVSVICLCYNQAQYVAEAIESALNQTYKNIELIVVDDASTDNSIIEIKRALAKYPAVAFISHEKNLGNCQAFNKGLLLARGEFIIDLAADDVLLPTRIAEGLKRFNEVEDSYGIHFCDANIINEKGEIIQRHFKRNRNGKPLKSIPQGDIYADLLARYIITAPSMMIRREVFDYLGGYDEQLEYEDFDFWVRSSRQFHYCFTDQILVNKRELKNSHTTNQYGKSPIFLESTLAVCKKALFLNKTKQEDLALRKRVVYEMRQAILSKHFDVANQFLNLYSKLGGNRLPYTIIIKLRINLSFLRRILCR